MSMIVDCKSQSIFWNRTDVTMLYFDDIKDFEILSQKEEYDLFDKIRYGSADEKAKAREKLIQSNQRFIVSVARKWSTMNNLPDLINEGNIGLIKAIDRFDHTRGGRFLTYAVWWIRKEMNSYLITKENVVKTKNAHKIYTSANKIRNDFYSREGRFPTIEEIKELIYKIYNYEIPFDEDLYEMRVSSIDDSFSSDKDDSDFSMENHSDYVSKSASCNIDDDIQKEYHKSLVFNLIEALNEDEKNIIMKLFGIDDVREWSADELAVMYNVSRERIRQLKFNILNKLKKEYEEVKCAV